MRPERLQAAEYAELLAVRGFKVLRSTGGFTAQCPFPERHAHGDRTPSLFIGEGRGQKLLLHCFGCRANFADLLAAVGVESPKSTQGSLSECLECQYLRIGSSALTVLGSISRTATIGIDPMDCRAAVLEVDFLPVYTGEADFMVKMPKRAGKVMRAVLEDLVELANERIEKRWTIPIAYGNRWAAGRLSVRPSAITEALLALEHHGVIERVRRLPSIWFGREGEGAWTWRLVVTPAVTPTWNYVLFDFAAA
jgi:hypothetical protein